MRTLTARLSRIGLSLMRKCPSLVLALILSFLILVTLRFDVRFYEEKAVTSPASHKTSTRRGKLTRNSVQEMEQIFPQPANLRAPFVRTGRPVGIPSTNSSNTKEKVILLWTTRFKARDWIRNKVLKKCSTRCRATMDRGELLQSDAVIMHDFDSLTDLPRLRQPNQRWVYHGMESPPHTRPPISTGVFDGIFNWTATYRMDSDLWIKNGYLRKRYRPLAVDEHNKYLKNSVRSKKRLALARISHCQNKTTERIQYIRELQKFARVDFYGECGDYSCPKHNNFCDHELMRKYKFFLAFENSYCRDYISEKFWFPLGSWGTVPVAWGGENGTGKEYISQAPPHSFINKADFTSPKQLGQFLNSLDKNRTEYERYFDWRKDYEVSTGYNWCLLCDALHDTNSPVQTYTQFKSWYTQDSCSQNKPRRKKKTAKRPQQSQDFDQHNLESIFSVDSML